MRALFTAAALSIGVAAPAQFAQGVLVHPGGGNTELSGVDIDGDGDLDLAGLFGGHHFKWFENSNGLGAFGPAISLLNENNAEDHIWSDIDGDLDSDLIIAIDGPDEIRVYTNNGLGEFALAHTLPLPSATSALACADVTGDGRKDILFTIWVNGTAGFGLFPGEVDAFGDALLYGQQHPGPPSSLLRIGDVDLVGGLDIVLRGADNLLILCRNTAGDGSLWTSSALPINGDPGSYPYFSPQLIDVDGDGDLDLAESRSPAVHWLRNELDEGGLVAFSENVIETWMGSGKGQFGPSPCGIGASVVFVPGDPDLPVRWNSYLPLLSGFAFSNDLTVPRGQGLSLADLNGDGSDDLILSTSLGVEWFAHLPVVETAELILPLIDTLCREGPPVELPDASIPNGRWYGEQVNSDLLFRANLSAPLDHPLTHASYHPMGCPVAATMTVRLIEGPVIETTVPDVICSGDASIPLISEPTAVDWYGLDGSNVIEPSTWNGGFIVCAFTDQTGRTCSDVAGPVVRWNTLPAQIADAGPFCSADQPVVIEALAAPPQSVTWIGPVEDATPESAVFDPGLGAGEYTLILDVQPYGPNQCGNADTLLITVHPSPEVIFDPPAPFCQDSEPITLDWAIPLDGFWSGPGVSAGQLDPGSLDPGVHLINYFFATDQGCGVQASTTIELVDSVTLDGPVQELYCQVDGPMQFFAEPSGGSWSQPVSANGILDPSLLEPGPYLLSYAYTDPRGCVLTSGERSFEVGIPKEVTIPELGLLCADSEPVEVIGSEPGAWSGAATGFGTRIFIDPMVLGIGSFELTLTVSPEDECPGSATILFEVDVCADIHETALNGVRTWPNPFTNKIHIGAGHGQLERIELFDAQGRCVFLVNDPTSRSGVSVVDTPGLIPGLYLLVTTVAGQPSTLRIVKG